MPTTNTPAELELEQLNAKIKETEIDILKAMEANRANMRKRIELMKEREHLIELMSNMDDYECDRANETFWGVNQ